MKRKIYDKLKEWKQKSNGRSAILIDGARRCGKSYIAEEFAKNEYKSYLLLDFQQADKQTLKLFDLYLSDLDTLLMYLETYYNVKLYKRESVIIFDEVQLCPRARAAIKYLVKDRRYDYIETGSLMSIKENVKDIVIPSEEEHLKMYPMDFEEFLWANENYTLMPFIEKQYLDKKPMGEIMHHKAMDYFRQYLIVGGMPQVVKTFVDNKNFEDIEIIKQNIINLYRNDIGKHAKGYQAKVESVFDEIPEQLQKHDKKFVLSSLEKDARFRNYENSFLWLDDAMIINMCYNSTEPTIGLKMRKDKMTFKCYMNDTGLLISHAFDENNKVSNELYKKLLKDKLEVNEGMIMENVVAQMLVASGHKLYFFSSYSKTKADDRMEIDFLIANKSITSRHNISAIEVKSSEKYTLSSLNKAKKKYENQLNKLYVLHTKDYKFENGIYYLPLYMTPLL